MPRRRRSQALPVAPPAVSPFDDLLVPLAGPNSVPPEKMTPRERMNEIVAILARGMARKMRGIPPFNKTSPDGAAPWAAPPGQAT